MTINSLSSPWNFGGRRENILESVASGPWGLNQQYASRWTWLGTHETIVLPTTILLRAMNVFPICCVRDCDWELQRSFAQTSEALRRFLPIGITAKSIRPQYGSPREEVLVSLPSWGTCIALAFDWATLRAQPNSMGKTKKPVVNVIAHRWCVAGHLRARSVSWFSVLSLDSMWSSISYDEWFCVHCFKRLSTEVSRMLPWTD